MAFGQAGGPPASVKDIARLAELLAEAGYETFREARHPYGLTQRQAAGKFTREEASELLERLEGEAEALDHDVAPPAPVTARHPVRRASTTDEVAASAAAPDDIVTAFPDELLADELVRRGWSCTPPS